MRSNRFTTARRSCSKAHRLAVVCGVVASSLVATQGTASAAPSPLCSQRMATGTHVVQKWVWAGGWGWTNWQVRPTVWASDSCDRGAINVSVNIPKGVVDQKGGQIAVYAYARYFDRATNKGGGWIPLKLTSTWPSYTFGPPNGAHVSMTSSTKIVQVAIATYLYIKQDGSNWVPTAWAWTYCTPWLSTTSSPGRCIAG